MECTGIKIDIWLVYMLLYKAEEPEVKKNKHFITLVFKYL